MRNLTLALGLGVMLILGTGVLLAVDQPVTLLDQSKGSGSALDPALKAVVTQTDATQNFVVQTGSASWSGIYGQTSGGQSGWIEITNTGDTEKIQIWCDIEMYLQTNIQNNLIYFHIGNLATLSATDKVAYVQGSFTSNNGQYIGLATAEGCDITLLKGTTDYAGHNVTAVTGYQPIGVTYTLTDQGGGYTGTGHTSTYRGYDDIGYGDQNSVQAMWWLINGGARATQVYEWKVTITPNDGQPDGHYVLDPIVVFKPAL